MKKLLILLAAVIAVILSSCAQTPYKGPTEIPTSNVPETQTALSPVPSETEAPLTDYGNTDFSGSWYVSELLASDGKPVSASKLLNIGGDFTLELSGDGRYYMYNGEGFPLGQGTYSVLLNQITLKAGEQETIYEIQDENTLCCKLEDNSITVMKHNPGNSVNGSENLEDH